MGLGALVAAIPLKDASERFKRLAMVMVYPTVFETSFDVFSIWFHIRLEFWQITPIGMAIGIGIHSSFNANDPSVIISQGAFGSLSYHLFSFSFLFEIFWIRAGILFYNTYTELFSSEVVPLFFFFHS